MCPRGLAGRVNSAKLRGPPLVNMCATYIEKTPPIYSMSPQAVGRPNKERFKHKQNSVEQNAIEQKQGKQTNTIEHDRIVMEQYNREARKTDMSSAQVGKYGASVEVPVTPYTHLRVVQLDQIGRYCVDRLGDRGAVRLVASGVFSYASDTRFPGHCIQGVLLSFSYEHNH